jgi:hypothetical protein
MNTTRALLGLATLVGGLALLPTAASAQRYQPGYAPTTLPDGYQDRGGQPMYGFSFGLGGMSLDGESVQCATCDYSPIAGEVDGHIGGMLNERFGLALELQFNAKTVDDNGDYGTVTMTQGALMASGQYWVTPKLWIKGGLGLAHLSYDYEDYYGPAGSDPVDDGAAVMMGAGVELFQSRDFAVDLQARLIETGYDGINKKLSAGTINLGFNWFGFGHSVIVVR